MKCTAHSSRTGQPCRRSAIEGGAVCATHGGRAPQVLAKARERILGAVLPAIGRLRKALEDEDVHAGIKAAKDLLDRAETWFAVDRPPGATFALSLDGASTPADGRAQIEALATSAIAALTAALASRDEQVVLRAAREVLDRAGFAAPESKEDRGFSLAELIGNSHHPKYEERNRVAAMSASAVMEECQRLHRGACPSIEAHGDCCAEGKPFPEEYWKYGVPTEEERRAVSEGRRQLERRSLPGSMNPATRDR